MAAEAASKPGPRAPIRVAHMLCGGGVVLAIIHRRLPAGSTAHQTPLTRSAMMVSNGGPKERYVVPGGA